MIYNLIWEKKFEINQYEIQNFVIAICIRKYM